MFPCTIGIKREDFTPGIVQYFFANPWALSQLQNTDPQLRIDTIANSITRIQCVGCNGNLVVKLTPNGDGWAALGQASMSDVPYFLIYGGDEHELTLQSLGDYTPGQIKLIFQDPIPAIGLNDLMREILYFDNTQKGASAVKLPKLAYNPNRHYYHPGHSTTYFSSFGSPDRILRPGAIISGVTITDFQYRPYGVKVTITRMGVQSASPYSHDGKPTTDITATVSISDGVNSKPFTREGVQISIRNEPKYLSIFPQAVLAECFRLLSSNLQL